MPWYCDECGRYIYPTDEATPIECPCGVKGEKNFAFVPEPPEPYDVRRDTEIE